MKYSSLFTLLLFIICIASFGNTVSAQSVSVGSLADEQLQLQMLLQDSVVISPINRPSPFSAYQKAFSSGTRSNKWWERSVLRPSDLFSGEIGDIQAGFFPFSIQNSLNTRFPYSENNGAAWYGRGNNTEFTGGFYLTSEYMSVNVQPQIIYQENRDFRYPRFVTTQNGQILFLAEGIANGIDAPFRFGPDSYTTIDPGNSSVRIHYKAFETGISTEPQWWGPMERYPLLMSNNAPGYLHAFIGTREPVRIPYVGKFQFKWMAGSPRESDYYTGPVSGNARFANAINVSYSPWIFKNLTVGFIRMIHSYIDDGLQLDDVTAIINPFQKDNEQNLAGEDEKNQTASVYLHILFPEANAEIFGEFFREDFSFNNRDFLMQPHHNSAYAFGFQKISHVPYVDFVKTHLEFTNLTTSQLRQVRPQTFMYTHSRVRHGHTNEGKILGAAIGPGSNSQFLAIDAYKDQYRFGVFAQRLVDNDNLHFRRASASLSNGDFGDFFRHRVNLNIGVNALYGPGPFYIHTKLVWTKAYNYGRYDLNELQGVTIRNYERNDRTNIHFQLGITYIL